MTVPVANPAKVKRRRQSEAITDCEKSYVFDYKEDQRARAKENDFPNHISTTRQKKRQLEQRFGSSAPTIPSPSTQPKRKTLPSHHSVPALRKNSDDSLVFDIEEARLVPSKAHQSLNGYIESGPKKKSGSKASGGTSASGDAKRKVQLRDTDRLLRAKSGLERQNSGLPKRSSHLSQSQQSAAGGSTNGRGRSPTKKRASTGEGGLSRSQSASRSLDRPSMTRSGSKSMGTRSKSVSGDSRPPPTKILAKQRSLSSDRRAAMQKGKSELSMGSKRSIMTGFSQATVITQGENLVVLVPVTREQAKEMAKAPPGTIPTMFKGYFPNLTRKIPPIEEKPPRSLVLIWVLISAELAFDLGSTIIAFTQLLDDTSCCGKPVELGPLPMTVTIPFFLLVTTELALLIRAMIMTMWPSMFTDEVTEEQREIRDSRSRFMQMLCCCLRWKVKFILTVLNLLIVVNPFFGCIIAWMLLYQSNKIGCFVVLGLEGASILLHFATVYLEGSCKTVGGVLFNAIPLIPFFLSISLVLVYLKQEGVCYLVEDEVFRFTGCEICPNQLPPVDNKCLINGTNYTVQSDGMINLQDLQDFSDIKGVLTNRVVQGEYCASSHPDGPDINFCFFNYSKSWNDNAKN